MSEIKLLPCPFCGGEAEVFTSDEIGYLGNDRYTVKCGSCICGTGHYKDRQRAIEMWNTRKPMERIVEQLEEKKNMYTKCENDCNMCDCHGCDLQDTGYQFYKNAIEIVKAGGTDERIH